MLQAMFTVLLKRRAEKQYGELPAKDKTKVLSALQGLREHPFAGKKLKGELSGLYSLRVWPYRILYTIERKIITVTVVAIGQRKEIYRKA